MAAREGNALLGSHPAWVAAVTALGVVALLAAAVLVESLAGRPGGEAWAETAAQQALGGHGGSGAIVSTTVLSDAEVVICIADPAKQRLAVYVADARKSRLRLLAVRDISADWALTDWNNDPPLPKDVRARVDKFLESGKPEPGAGGENK